MVGQKRPLAAKMIADQKIYLGIIMQDSGTDLNVYHNEATETSGKNFSTHDPEQYKGCCAQTGYSATESGLVDVGDIDFNEWTGKQSALISGISMA